MCRFYICVWQMKISYYSRNLWRLRYHISLPLQRRAQPVNQKVQNYKVIQNMMNSNVSIQYQQFQNNAPV